MAYNNMAEQKQNITHVSIPYTLYGLLHYLLLFDDDIVFNHTHYFLTDTSNAKIREALHATYFQSSFGTDLRSRIKRKIVKIKYVLSRRKYPFLKTAAIFANGSVSSLWIGNRSYSLLADAPDSLTHNMNEDSLEWKRQQLKWNKLSGKIEALIYGKPMLLYLGNNNQCTDIYLTEENFSPVLKGKRVHVESLESLWNKASEQKKDFILQLFDINEETKKILSSKPLWFFTQPFTTDAKMTDEEYALLLQKIIDKYGESNLLIKLHPRDKFNYKQFFPNITIFDKRVNMQLLILAHLLPQKAVAICTGAIDCLPETVELDWLGAGVHDKVLSFFGDSIYPHRKYQLVKL